MSSNTLLGAPPTGSFKDLDSMLKEYIARFNHPEDPLAAWKNDLDDWIKAIKSFNEAEQRNIYQEDQPDEVTWRFHRFLLHSLIGRGEHLALQLLSLQAPGEEKKKQLEYVDAFLTDLRLTVETWHKVGAQGRANPLSKYL